MFPHILGAVLIALAFSGLGIGYRRAKKLE
jgi:hypothetical protein